MAVQLRARSRAHPQPRRRVRYDLTPPAPPSLPPEVIVRPPWRSELVLFELREWGALERERDLARLEVKALRQLTTQLQRERDAARRTLAILAQQALEREWMPDEGTP